MESKEAIFLFREGSDDYTLWIVELPEDEVASIQTGTGIIRGSLASLMSQLPLTTMNTTNRLQMLSHDGKEYVLHAKDVPLPTLEQYLLDGCSVRGTKRSILEEIRECFFHPQGQLPMHRLL